MVKIIADDKIPFLKGVFESFSEIEYYPGKEISPDIVKDADALIVRTRTRCNKKLLSGSRVKLITTATIGFDHIDIDYCSSHNIKWVNAPGCNSTSVMQYVASALLNIAEKNKFNLADKTIGIVGVGNVGRKVQKLADIFGMKILLNDPPRERAEGSKDFCSLENIMGKSDIITLHVPLINEGSDRTYHLLDKDFLNNLPHKPIIINTSRGEVINSGSIKEAIVSGKIKDAVLDVWENEPDIDLDLLNLAAIGTPHIAGYSADGKANGTSVCVNEINKFFEFGIRKYWYPENIPDDENGNHFNIDGEGKDDQQIFFESVLKTYDVMRDDDNLRNNPADFELLRGNYRVRREFNNFEVELRHCNSCIIEKLNKMNFNINCN